ncbi:unnamed protein product [Thlaspi arvense]|uniref:Uncharacterized protein n=1 Tax=Thlaspi arvense TaxID=13288 RepID=A0AAU9SED4_THLAR|nr:unnamed protein product [Thlaspi arvense]
MAIHNNGAKTIERRWDEMTAELGGEEPDIMTFIDVMHTNLKTGVKDKKAQSLTETAMAKVAQIASQRQAQEEEPLTQAEINAVVLEEIPKIKGRRFGVATLRDKRNTSSYKSTNVAHEDQLRNEIQTMKKDQIEKHA